MSRFIALAANILGIRYLLYSDGHDELSPSLPVTTRKCGRGWTARFASCRARRNARARRNVRLQTGRARGKNSRARSWAAAW